MAFVARKSKWKYNRLTPEGLVFVTVLLFVTIGALLRNVNLLILMAGMMSVSLLLNWRVAVHRLKTVSIKRRLSRDLVAGELTSIQWECRNRSQRLAGWDFVISDQIERLGEEEQTIDFVASYEKFKPASLIVRVFGEILERLRRLNNESVSRVKFSFPRILANQSDVRSYRVYFGNRGKYTIGPASLISTFPFGLILSRVEDPVITTFFVGPRLGKLDPTWEKRLQSTAIGSEAVKRQRSIEEDEFYALRPWRSGDSRKNIHWRTTARLQTPMVKQYDQRNNRDFALMLDLYSEADNLNYQQKCELAISFAATAMRNIDRDVQGQVALGVCGMETDICCSRTAQGILLEANRRLSVAKPSHEPQTDLALSRLVSLVSGETPIYVISSRPQPELFDAEVLDRAIEASGDPGQSRELRLLRQNLPLVRWLCVDSKEVEEIFSMDVVESNSAELAKVVMKIQEDDPLISTGSLADA